MQINPDKMRYLMVKTGLDHIADLAARSRVSAKTIDRIFKEVHNSQPTTVTRLAKALGVPPEDLALPPAPDAKRHEQDQNAYSYRHAFTLTGSKRLNFDLVSHRYGVPQAEILKAAPALFALVAEMSLAKRRADLKAARATLPPVPAHLKAAASVATCWLADVLNAEEASIAAADIFGRQLDAGLAEDDMEADFRLGTPFEAFFVSCAETASDEAFLWCVDAFDDETEDDEAKKPIKKGFPRRLFPADLDTITGNDRAAALALERGRVRIQAIPADLMAQDRIADRLAFLESQLTEEDLAWLHELREMSLDDLFPETKEPPHGL